MDPCNPSQCHWGTECFFYNQGGSRIFFCWGGGGGGRGKMPWCHASPEKVAELGGGGGCLWHISFLPSSPNSPPPPHLHHGVGVVSAYMNDIWGDKKCRGEDTTIFNRIKSNTYNRVNTYLLGGGGGGGSSFAPLLNTDIFCQFLLYTLLL